jgi:starch synthase
MAEGLARRPRGVEPIRVLLAASEVVGFAKTGGLADVAGTLPAALSRRGVDCAILLPLHHCARAARFPPQPTDHVLRVPVGKQMFEGRLWRSRLADADVPVYLVEQAEFFDRDDARLGKGLYQFTDASGARRDYPDNCSRFSFFSRAVLEAIRLLDFWPDVLHLNDWQTGLVPALLREDYQHHRDAAARARYQSIRTLFTIHNIAYQGVFWHWDLPLTGLDWSLFNHHQLEFYGKLNFLKAGLVFSDYLNTVSPTYAREIQTPYYGCGMQGVLSQRRDRLSGIVNGIDPTVWDPATDPLLPAHYDAEAVQPGKGQCKEALQQRLGLSLEPTAPLLGVVARLAEQKGVDLIINAAPPLLTEGCQLALLGDGDPRYVEQLRELVGRFPGRVGLLFGFDEGLAHLIEAGADLFLMPSLYEPSGLNQLYSMRYGTPPVVRATGGLADTVTDASSSALADGSATGFRFLAYTAEAFLDAVRRAVAMYRYQPNAWSQVVANAMRADWSWDRSAASYEALYQRIMGS